MHCQLTHQVREGVWDLSQLSYKSVILTGRHADTNGIKYDKPHQWIEFRSFAVDDRKTKQKICTNFGASQKVVLDDIDLFRSGSF